ncbi:TPA: uridine phosphorylase [bacterium]|nr:MAG: uridine phosphorylase [Candidatus Hydrogenedentes bacterium CG1_02_42_14]PIU47791.1 MAG: uridine phosphorylase [Candidatus Hydrogenedentes bacterium CG07_land_8_20_14_0_80_42_17]HBW46628.1 uridine phosphorylase [bacterium]
MSDTNSELQYHIHLKPGDVGRYVLMPGDPGRVPKIAEFFDDAKEIAFNREYRTFTGTVDGIKISCTSTGIGCPSTAIAVEELIKLGADTFIRIGTAGSLQKEVGLGDICITTGSVREEGTTRQYVPLSYPAIANLDVTLALRESAKKLGLKHHCGISHCKDAFFIEGDCGLPLEDENKSKWKAWYRSNVLSTSMESAALFVVSSIKRVRAGEVLAIIGLTYDDAPIIAKVGIDEAIKCAIEAVKILHREDSSK